MPIFSLRPYDHLAHPHPHAPGQSPASWRTASTCTPGLGTGSATRATGGLKPFTQSMNQATIAMMTAAPITARPYLCHMVRSDQSLKKFMMTVSRGGNRWLAGQIDVEKTA